MYCAGVISMAAVGLQVDSEAAAESSRSIALASRLLDQLFPAVLRAFRSPDVEVSAPLVPFLQVRELSSSSASSC